MAALGSLLDLLVPAACAGCGRLSGILCRPCRDSFVPAGDPRDRFLAADRGIVIGQALTLAIAAFAYVGPMRNALQRLKYGGASRVAAPLARAALPAAEHLLAVTDARVTLVPVPIHPSRLRQRGYNQARLLAGALGALSGLAVEERIVRSRETTRQHGLDRAARLRNLKEAFAPAPTTSRDPERPIVIIDDILTTSATLEACASVLRQAGSTTVYGFAVAREI